MEPSERADQARFVREENALMDRVEAEGDLIDQRMYVHSVCMWSVLMNRNM